MERLLFVSLLYVVSASHFVAEDGSLILSPSTGQTEEPLPVLIPQTPSQSDLQNSPFPGSPTYQQSLQSPLQLQLATPVPFLPRIPGQQILPQFQQLPQLSTAQIFLPLPQKFSAPQASSPPRFTIPQPIQPITTFSPQNPICGPANSMIDATRGVRAYHFSWCREPTHFSWDQARSYCQRVHPDFQAISIEDRDEDDFVTTVLSMHSIKYIWTSGNKLGSNSWRWLTGNPVVYNNWSYTGGQGRPQPDNREGNEVCLGVLNNFYNDGIKWHDIACHHLKPVICETRT